MLNLALRDAATLPPSEAFVLLRFDVTYSVPITALPLRWPAVNMPVAAFADWRTCDMVHDLLFVLPRVDVAPFCQALDQVGHANTTAAEVVRWTGWAPDRAVRCAGLVASFTSRADLGGAHFVAPLLRRIVGERHVHTFDPHIGLGSGFAKIERTCGPAMSACAPG